MRLETQRKLFTYFLVVAGCASLGAQCGQEPIESITINGMSEVFLGVPTIFGADSTDMMDSSFQWSSSNDEVLAIDPNSGEVTGVSPGMVEVRAIGNHSMLQGVLDVTVSDLGMGSLEFGLVHQPLGQAELAKARTSVTNIGSSGEDGVFIDTGRVSFVWLDLFDLTLADTGDGVVFSAQMNPVTGEKIFEDSLTVSLANVGSTITINADFSALTLGDFYVEVLRDGGLVESTDAAILDGTVLSLASDAVLLGVQMLQELRPPREEKGTVMYADSVFVLKLTELSVILLDGSRLIGDEVRISASSLAPTTVVPPMYSVGIRAANISRFEITRERILPDGLYRSTDTGGLSPPMIEALGEAVFCKEDDGDPVRMVNIGSSGLDGVALSPPVSVDNPTFDNPTEFALHFGAGIQLNIDGEELNIVLAADVVGTPPDVMWDAVSLEHTNDGTNLVLDWSPITKGLLEVSVYNGQDLTGTLFVGNGALLRVLTHIVCASTTIASVTVDQPGFNDDGAIAPSVTLTFGEVKRIVLVKGQTFEGDRIRISPPNSLSSKYVLERIEIYGVSLAAFGFSDLTFTEFDSASAP